MNAGQGQGHREELQNKSEESGGRSTETGVKVGGCSGKRADLSEESGNSGLTRESQGLKLSGF